MTGKVALAARLLLRRAAPPALVVIASGRVRRSGAVPALAALAAWTVTEALAEDQSANQAAASSAEDRGTRAAVLAAHLLAWWAPLGEAARYPRGRSVTATAAGLAMLGAGATLRVAAVRTLGARFTAHVRVTTGQPVCDRGPYRLIRHPSYAGLFLLNVGAAVACRSWRAAGLVAVATTASVAWRVRVEERALARVLGEPYHEYCARTPRWLPRLSSHESTTVQDRGGPC